MIKLKFINIKKLNNKQKLCLILGFTLLGTITYDKLTTVPEKIIEEVLEETNLLRVSDYLYDFYSLIAQNTNCKYRLYKINKDSTIEYKDFDSAFSHTKEYNYFYLDDFIQKDKSK